MMAGKRRIGGGGEKGNDDGRGRRRGGKVGRKSEEGE